MKATLCKKRSIGFPHRPSETGGPGSFQVRLSSALEKKGWDIVYPDSGVVPDIVLVVGGTVKLHWLWRCRTRGARIVHRVDGINWLHRLLPTPLSIRAMQEIRNCLMRLITTTFADHVVYQSAFVRTWWRERFGATRRAASVIYNGVDLSVFCPRRQTTGEKPILLCVEGNIQDDRVSTSSLEYLARRLHTDSVISRTAVYGHVEEALAHRLSKVDGLELRGQVPRMEIHEVYSNAVFLSLDINASCPNAVIEALASGIPVIGFDTGALRELVSPEAGILVPYDGDPWKLEAPNVSALERAARQVLAQWHGFSEGARAVAEKRFGLDRMVDSYLEVFEGTGQKDEHSDENCG